MITRFALKNFKRIGELELDLSSRVALVGPNNSGKTTLLQALTIWDIGLRKWSSQRSGSKAKTRTGVTINRNDLLSTPIPSALLLWKDLHVRKTELKENDKTGTKNLRFELCAEGVTGGKTWKAGFEFDYANTESFYCRLLENKTSKPVKEAMRTAVEKTIAPMHLEDPADPWWHDEKMSDHILAPVFSRYYKELGLPVAMNKGDYYQLVSFIRPEEVDPEVNNKLDSLLEFLRAEQDI